MKQFIFITGCLLMLLFTACKKELSDNFNPYTNSPLNDTIWTRTLAGTAAVHDLFDLLAPDRIIDSFALAQDTVLNYGDSLSVQFKANSCVVAGVNPQPALSGFAKIAIIPLRKRGDFIKFFRPTSTDNGSVLMAGAGVYIKVWKEEKELSLAQGGTVKIRIPDPDTPKLNMQAFYGKESIPVPLKGIDTAFSWVRDQDTTLLPLWTKASTDPLRPLFYHGYEINAKSLHWIAAERYSDSSLPKVKVTAVMSPNFTNKNTAVFLVFNQQKTVVNLRADYPSRSFFANNIPLGISAKLISITKIGGDFYLGIESISSVANVTRHTIKPNKTSLKDILSYLNSL